MDYTLNINIKRDKAGLSQFQEEASTSKILLEALPKFNGKTLITQKKFWDFFTNPTHRPPPPLPQKIPTPENFFAHVSEHFQPKKKKFF